MTGSTAVRSRLERWQRLVGDAGLDGWLVADFRWNNPLFARLLDLHAGILTRRCFLWLPAQGEPVVMASRTDGHTVSHLDCQVILYPGYNAMTETLQTLLTPGSTIAMEYVPQGTLPTVSRVDAGMVELIRSFGVEIRSSGSLIATLEVWDGRQQDLHRRAATAVDGARQQALARCEELLRRGDRVTEGMLADLISTAFTDNGMEAHAPDVGVGAHAADPHYSIAGEGAEIGRDQVLLLDLATKLRDVDGAPYGDTTWMAFTGSEPPADLLRTFALVRAARDAAIDAINAATAANRTMRGQEVDRIARSVIADAGMADHLIHRTGHSLGTDHVHGMGTNLDDIEFPDDRSLLRESGFTVEPGLYFPGRFGVRLEVSAILHADGVEVTTERQVEMSLFA